MLEELPRCWRLNYANEFHLDITPSIVNHTCVLGGELVPDKKVKEWCASNPKGYKTLFDRRASLLPSLRVLEADLEKRLRSDESDRLSRLARVTARAIDVLGSEENAVHWLRQPNGALGGVSPLSYLNTDVGARRVEAILSHIDYGDVS
jgi:hypothetical protein